MYMLFNMDESIFNVYICIIKFILLLMLKVYIWKSYVYV